MFKAPYTPYDWFWVVGKDTSRAWSSAVSAYVDKWEEAKTTFISDEQSLTDVLRPYGLQGPVLTEADYAALIQAYIDKTANSRGYADGAHLVSYFNSTIPSWQAEAAAFIPWRDSVWMTSYVELEKVRQGGTAPTADALLKALPEMVWPVAKES